MDIKNIKLNYMNRIDFYKWITDRTTKMIHKPKNILIFYDYQENFFDIKNNKIRIGIKNADKNKFKSLAKLLSETLKNQKIDLIDLRFTLKYDFNNEDQINLLFNFVSKHLSNDGVIIGFINSLEDIENEMINGSSVDKGDQIWNPEIDLSNSHDFYDNKVIVKSKNYEEIQYLTNILEFEKILSQFRLVVKDKINLNNFNHKLIDHNDKSLIGEYVFVLGR